MIKKRHYEYFLSELAILQDISGPLISCKMANSDKKYS